MLQFW